jgi:hypothetical protein
MALGERLPFVTRQISKPPFVTRQISKRAEAAAGEMSIAARPLAPFLDSGT